MDLHVLFGQTSQACGAKRILKNAGANVFSMDDILTQPVDGSGYNEQYGILGSNIIYTAHCIHNGTESFKVNFYIMVNFYSKKVLDLQYGTFGTTVTPIGVDGV